MDMTLFPYENVIDILNIARENKADIDVGLNMFLNNIEDIELYKQGKDMYWYHGADYVDYAALKPEVEKLGNVEVTVRKNIFRTVYMDNYKDLSKLRRAGQDDALKALFLQKVAEYPGLDKFTMEIILQSAKDNGYDISAYQDVIDSMGIELD